MRRGIFSFLLAGCLCLGMLSCGLTTEVQEMTEDKNIDADKDSWIVGSWVTYVPDGEWGPSLEVYDFYPDRRYRVIVVVLSEKDHTQTLPTGLAIKGTYTFRGNTILFKTANDDTEQRRKFEIHDEALFIELKDGSISILQRVSE
jgi:hypothetical protein